MHADDLIRHLGRADDHPDLLQALARLGARKVPRIQGAAADARLALPTHGVEFVFAPVDGNKRHGLELREVLLQGGPRPFTGRLPFELAWTDARADARKKVGPPMHVDDTDHHDSWDYRTHSMTVYYARDRKRIVGVRLATPYDDDD